MKLLIPLSLFILIKPFFVGIYGFLVENKINKTTFDAPLAKYIRLGRKHKLSRFDQESSAFVKIVS